MIRLLDIACGVLLGSWLMLLLLGNKVDPEIHRQLRDTFMLAVPVMGILRSVAARRQQKMVNG